jgi:hypothetical protein
MRRDLLVIAVLLCVGVGRTLEAQQGSKLWAAGVEVQAVDAPGGQTPFLGLTVSRVLATSGLFGVRLQASGAAAGHAQNELCRGFGVCDQRKLASLMDVAAVATVGSPEKEASGSPLFAFAGLGWYASQWKGGTYTSSQGVVPPTTVSGAGPSGLSSLMGLGVLIPGTSRSLRLELQASRLESFADSASKWNFGVGLHFAW